MLLGVIAAPAQAADRDPSTILVKFSIPSQAAGIRARSATGRPLVSPTASSSCDYLDGACSPSAAVALYSRLFGIAYAEPNYIATADLASPNDPSFSSQWSLCEDLRCERLV